MMALFKTWPRLALDDGGGTFTKDCHFSCALQILLENLQRVVDDDDAEVESQICHVKLMDDSLCQILGKGLQHEGSVLL